MVEFLTILPFCELALKVSSWRDGTQLSVCMLTLEPYTKLLCWLEMQSVVHGELLSEYVLIPKIIILMFWLEISGVLVNV